MTELIERCADIIAQASGLLITAGAGMGVDSGLPDFRGTEGFWRAYPALAQARIAFEQIANPHAFQRHPRLAWGFYGHRLDLYRKTSPHDGFRILRKISDRLDHGGFVVTSNVDGHFQQAGFEPQSVCEIHGSIHWLQCFEPCCDEVWPAEDVLPATDSNTCELISPLPLCPRCGALARPNILMFNDFGWIDHRSEQQHRAFQSCINAQRRPVILEFGAGTSIPSIRRLGDRSNAPLIRVNPTAPQVEQPGHLGVKAKALDFLMALETQLRQRGFMG